MTGNRKREKQRNAGKMMSASMGRFIAPAYSANATTDTMIGPVIITDVFTALMLATRVASFISRLPLDTSACNDSSQPLSLRILIPLKPSFSNLTRRSVNAFCNFLYR